jgi:hypothetical protein
MLFFKTMQLSTSTKPILKEIFIHSIQNKVVQLWNNTIVKGNYIFWKILNDYRVHLWENKCYHNILENAYKMTQIIEKLDEVFFYILNMSWLYHFNYNWKFD